MTNDERNLFPKPRIESAHRGAWDGILPEPKHTETVSWKIAEKENIFARRNKNFLLDPKTRQEAGWCASEFGLECHERW